MPGRSTCSSAPCVARTGLPLAFAVWITVGALTLVAWALGRRPGLGTVVGPFVVGPTMQSMLTNLERFEPPRWVVVRIAIHLLAVGVVGFGAGAVMASRLGQGTGELLALAASDRSGRPEQRMRLMFEVTWLAVGGLLGGPIGLGTVLVALCIGPSVATRAAHGRRAASPPRGARSAPPTGRCHADHPRCTVRRVKVHLVDGTYELFRQHFGGMNRRGESAARAGAVRRHDRCAQPRRCS